MSEIHPSGLESEAELAYTSAEFFSEYSDKFSPHKAYPHTDKMWEALLAFQKGWKACKDFYNINE
jgi:hypothetical protein